MSLSEDREEEGMSSRDGVTATASPLPSSAADPAAMNPLALQVAIEIITTADEEARAHGLAGGLCDAIDNDGVPFQSSALASALRIVGRASGADFRRLEALFIEAARDMGSRVAAPVEQQPREEGKPLAPDATATETQSPAGGEG